MNEEIFHTCSCTGQKFTRDEWHKYIKESGVRDIVHEYEGYRYNIFDVCLNPKPIVNETKYGCTLEISICKSDCGRYDNAIHIDLSMGSVYASPASFYSNEKNGQSSEREAITIAFQRAKNYIENAIERKSSRKQMEEDEDETNLIKNLKAFYKFVKILEWNTIHKQLSLFDD